MGMPLVPSPISHPANAVCLVMLIWSDLNFFDQVESVSAQKFVTCKNVMMPPFDIMYIFSLFVQKLKSYLFQC